MARINNISSLEKAIKTLGYDNFKRVTSSRLLVYIEPKERVDTLKLFAEAFDGRYTSQKSGTGWRSSVGAALLPGGFVILAKPQLKGTGGSLSTIDARVFASLAKTNKFSFNGKEIDVVTFTDPETIATSIIKGCRNSTVLGDTYAETFEDFFSTKKLMWNPEIPIQAVNKLGVYVGELLIGWVFLNRSHSQHFTTNPFRGRAKAFHLPTDPAFSSVDSFIEMEDSSYYAISSKFGGGAKASIFTNLFEKGIERQSKLSKSFFKEMCNHAHSKNIAHTKSRSFVYSFGVHKILKIGADKIPNADRVFEAIKTNHMTDEVQTVISSILAETPDKAIRDALPHSTSAFFNRTIAQKLNDDRSSIDQMREILAGKDYWQANLNKNSWIKGDLKFSFVSSRDAKLRIIGNKSPIPDLTSKQGWINYELQY